MQRRFAPGGAGGMGASSALEAPLCVAARSTEGERWQLATDSATQAALDIERRRPIEFEKGIALYGWTTAIGAEARYSK
jgi:hypothetical protein